MAKVEKISISLTGWVQYARTVRGATLVERNKEYIEAAACLALPARRILFRHLLPNCLPPLIVVATVQVAHAIALEATLSFLGLGIQPPTPTWGLMISEGRGRIAAAWWVALIPGIAITLLVLSVNLFGDWLRDRLDPRLRREML